MLRVHCVVPEIRSGNHKQHDFVCDLPLTARRGYGGHSEGETPGPIPNPEAKPFSADGTALVTVWESRTPPDKHSQRSPTRVTGWAISAFRGAPSRVGPSVFPGPFPGQIMTGHALARVGAVGGDANAGQAVSGCGSTATPGTHERRAAGGSRRPFFRAGVASAQ